MRNVTFARTTRAVILALTIGATAFVAAPVQAQGFGFSFGFGDRPSHLPHRLCLLTDSQLRRAIGRQGFEDIFLNVANNNRIQVRASRGKWVYLLRVNSCTGRILDGERLRRR